MNKVKVSIIGAGGTTGYKIARNLANHADEFDLVVCEIDPDQVVKLQNEGFHVMTTEDAIPISDIVIPAINDSKLKAFTPSVVKAMKSGSSMIVLDPASVVAGEIPQRDDCNLAICHPCHPSSFHDQDTSEARADKWGGNGGKMDLVLSLVYGSEEAFAICRKTCEIMFEPVVKSYVMTPRQMAFLEPTMVEVLGATCLMAMAETLEEAVKRGIDREAATSFLCGHIQNVAFTFVGLLGNTKVSDACRVAMDIGQRLVLREDWKKIWEDDVLDRVILTMLHPDQPLI